MNTIQPTFESLLDQLTNIYLRIDNYNGTRYLVAGGITQEGKWIEFPTQLHDKASLQDITRSLQVIVNILQVENKTWSLEKPHLFLIREPGLHLN